MNKSFSNNRTDFLYNRRHFLKSLSIASAGLGSGVFGIVPESLSASKNPVPEISRVSFVTGKDRREMIYQALKPFETEIKNSIKNKQVIIKPNNVWDGIPLCATDPDAIRGVLDFLKPLYGKTVIIAESTASPKGTEFTFNEYGYTPLVKEYNAKLFNLNKDSYTVEWILSENGYPLDIKIIDTFQNPNNYIISLARMKTHNSVVATLALKNMVMASPLNVSKDHPDFVRNQFEKSKMHQGGPVGINYNMFLIALKVYPEFSIIDGFVGMEGNGPAGGTPVEHGVALAGPNVITVDRVGVELMGINYENIGYLQWCARAGLGEDDLSKIQILGPDISTHKITYKLHENIDRQLQWKKS